MEYEKTDVCDHPNCYNKRLKGSRFCNSHSGYAGAKATMAKELRNYRLGQWQARVSEKSTSSELKSLTEEIAILRQIIQEHLLQCSDETDLILKSGPISDLIIKVNTLVTNCNNIDKTLGNLIDKEKVVFFAQTILSIITPYIPEEKVDELNSKIQDALGVL